MQGFLSILLRIAALARIVAHCDYLAAGKVGVFSVLGFHVVHAGAGWLVEFLSVCVQDV